MRSSHAVAEGARRFDAIAVVTENGVTPCGACRQVLAEFGPAMTVIVADEAGRAGSTPSATSCRTPSPPTNWTAENAPGPGRNAAPPLF